MKNLKRNYDSISFFISHKNLNMLFSLVLSLGFKTFIITVIGFFILWLRFLSFLVLCKMYSDYFHKETAPLVILLNMSAEEFGFYLFIYSEYFFLSVWGQQFLIFTDVWDFLFIKAI